MCIMLPDRTELKNRRQVRGDMIRGRKTAGVVLTVFLCDMRERTEKKSSSHDT